MSRFGIETATPSRAALPAGGDGEGIGNHLRQAQ